MEVAQAMEVPVAVESQEIEEVAVAMEEEVPVAMEEEVPVAMEEEVADRSRLDDDGRPKRTGTFWTATAHIITAVIGSGVLALPWAVAQLGWIAGPVAMLLFASVTYYTSTLLSACYRVNGNRNYNYTDAVRITLGRGYAQACGWLQYANLIGVAISFTISSAISMMAITRANCIHSNRLTCRINGIPYVILFGAIQTIFSLIPDFTQLRWVSPIAAAMSFTYSFISLFYGISQIVRNKAIHGSLTGMSVGPRLTEIVKIWRILQALGDIAFAYSFSVILIEIQDTIRSPPAESTTMKKASLVSLCVTTVFYLMCGCFGYGASGDQVTRNILTEFGFYDQFWLLDLANAATVVHHIGAYQLYCQPFFGFVEKLAMERYPESRFVTRDINVSILGHRTFSLNLFRLVGRTTFVVITTFVSMLFPFFNDIVGLLGAIEFWSLTVYFPVEMYISQSNVAKWSAKWLRLQMLSIMCFVIAVGAVVASIASIIGDFKGVKPFHFIY